MTIVQIRCFLMPVSCHFHGCKTLLCTVKRCYIKFHVFVFAFLASKITKKNMSKHILDIIFSPKALPA